MKVQDRIDGVSDAQEKAIITIFIYILTHADFYQSLWHAFGLTNNRCQYFQIVGPRTVR